MRTALTDALGIDVPVIQGSHGPWTSATLTAAICEAGALGTIGAALRRPEQVADDIRRVREGTGRPFAVNHTARPVDEGAWRVTLDAAPPVVSFALGDPGDRVAQAHAVGARFVMQVHSVEQAKRVAELEPDVIVAQGGEAGGFGGWVSTMALVPQVVDAVAPIPVAAAGGIADGRGLAAALVLGAAGVNIGTRFLASAEAEIADEWKQALVGATSEDAVKAEFVADVVPASAGSYDVVPRVLGTPFVATWNADRDAARANAAQLRDEIADAARDGRLHEYVPFSGQTAGLISEVLPVAEILRRLIEDAREALRSREAAARSR